ncbi:zinc finger CCCH type motif-containing protein [Babesia ovis]|uniref:Zinc finger CCCH type motif-containing protein n=1 Tax=Babesia ovis TaxID=5869 RepID=A0A9W5TDG6_BABOV|nr:zinc finger CCCH type motif-containing protein [Babesia ovis]
MFGGRGGNFRSDVWYAPRQDNYRSRGQANSSGGGSNYRNNNNSNNASRRGGKPESESMICKHHALHDVCPKGVSAVALCRVNDSRLDLFAVGQGTSVRRLSLAGDMTGGVSLMEQNTFTLNLQEALKQPYQPRNRRSHDQFFYSLQCINDCLFAGLRTGHISVFHIPTGTSTLIYGHSAPVVSVIMVDPAVLSACEAGKICIWSFDSVSNSFSCVNTLETNTTISCILEVTDGVNRRLWAGGSAITVIDLATLAVVRTCPIPNGDFAKCMVLYGQHVIVALQSGDCVVLDANAELVYRLGGDGVALTAMGGMQSEQGDLLLLGNKNGLLNIWQLPAFNLDGSINCNSEGSRSYKWPGISAITSLGGGLFVMAGYDGNMHVFRYTANKDAPFKPQ